MSPISPAAPPSFDRHAADSLRFIRQTPEPVGRPSSPKKAKKEGRPEAAFD
jgi:hypothetical protein